MRQVLFLSLLGLAVAAMASATPLCTSLIGSSILDQQCEAGGLTFGPFDADDAGGVLSPKVSLSGVSFSGNTVVLSFDPHLGKPDASQDIYFTFEVTGQATGVDMLGVDLSNAGGSLTSVLERVCSGPLDAGVCKATQLAEMIAFGNASDSHTFDAPESTIFVWKDISAPEGSHISRFNEGFITNVPEPVTSALIGSGLLVLGLVRRRARG